MATRNRGIAKPVKPTAPSRPTPAVPRLGGGGGSIGFYQDTISELGKVVWPGRDEVAKLTLVVVGTVIAVFAYIWILDQVFTFIVKELYGVH